MYDNLYDIENYEFLDDESTYGYDEGDEVGGSDSMDFYDILKYCVQPTVTDAYFNLSKLFILCFMTRSFTLYSNSPNVISSLLSILSGILGLYIYFQEQALYIILTTLCVYLLLRLISSVLNSFRGYIICASLMIFLTMCELHCDTEQWHMIRGPQMILAMKVISLAFDLDSKLVEQVNILEFFSYILCAGTCVFGPWVSYTDYKTRFNSRIWNFKWILKVVLSAVLSFVFFTSSVCWIEWLIPAISNNASLVYRDALLFRTSHYFVSYASETSAVLAGFGSSPDGSWKLSVSKPSAIELPYSLVEVVVHWNIPMHRWLKTYIFKTTRKLGSFAAVMVTYSVSSMLHSLNIRLAAVLLSLGIYTYIEYSFRDKLSRRFDACVTSRPCSIPCFKHKYSTSNLIVNTCNVMFTGLAVFHLAYLGILIEASNSHSNSLNDIFLKWQNLNFISHVVVIATYIIGIVI